MEFVALNSYIHICLPLGDEWLLWEGPLSLVKNPVLYAQKSTSSKGALNYTVWCLQLEYTQVDGRKDIEEYLWEIWGIPLRIYQPQIFIEYLVSKMRLWVVGSKEQRAPTVYGEHVNK